MTDIKQLAKAEQYLNSIRNLDLEIDALDTARSRYTGKRQDLIDQAENIGAALNGVCIQHPVGSKTENIGVQLADLPTYDEFTHKVNQFKCRIIRKKEELVSRKQDAMDVIDQMKDAQLRSVIINRYVNDLQWSTIADLMGFTEHYVRIDIKWRAIEEFTQHWKTPT